MNQKILNVNGNYDSLDTCLTDMKIGTLMLVCDESIRFLKISDYFETLTERLGIELVIFSDFKPNPLYESVVSGVELFRKSGCEAVFAVGGGSAMDVAKCIKLYVEMPTDTDYVFQDIVPNNIPLLAMPTTAGTGSEATRYAVIYYKGEKQSVTHDSIIPSTVVMDVSVLETLPIYQKKSTMLDALCHAVESFWSVNSTKESREYSEQAITDILKYFMPYLGMIKDSHIVNRHYSDCNKKMLWASHIAGKAINITQTTAGHAMCYKLTSLYKIAHGHAAALCVSKLWLYMLNNIDKCIDGRGEEYLKSMFNELAIAFGCSNALQAAQKFQAILDIIKLDTPVPDISDFPVLISSVNPVRLKNNPVALDNKAIEDIYRQILLVNRKDENFAYES